MAFTQYLNDMVFTNEYGMNSDNTFKFSDVEPSSETSQLELALYLPSDLNEFYNYINNDKVYYTLKLFSFKSYTTLKFDYFTMCNEPETYNNKLHIGDIYQGMGHYVALYYDFTSKCYFFMVQGGSNDFDRLDTQTTLSQLNSVPQQSKFKTITECFKVINDMNCEYYDDVKFLFADFVIKS